MGRIHLLDKSVSELIAAGEVVERPAAIIKELLENSLDAGATDITVEIKGGGISYIRVTDNGSGIHREDIEKIFLRHATSKVQTAEDLAGIYTFGFRGEAMASIAAMCRVELITKTDADEEGCLCTVEGGGALCVSPAGCPTGTTVIVRDVFFNTPARMKFLKKDVGEGNAVAQVVDKCALGRPEVAFRFIRDGQIKLTTSGSGDLLSVIRAVYGRDMAESMLEVEYEHQDIVRVSGYISAPSFSKPSRVYQNFYINRRYVRTRTVAAALEEGFKNKLMGGKFPACVLNLDVNVKDVDVNVHPAKIEVRFADEKPIFHAVYFAVKSALLKDISPVAAKNPVDISKIEQKINPFPLNELPPVQQQLTAQEFRAMFDVDAKEKYAFNKPISMNRSNVDIAVEETPIAGEIIITQIPKPPVYDKIIHEESDTILLDDETKSKKETTIKSESLIEPRLIGELSSTYILLELGGELLFVDKHAAHERILYERIKENAAYGNRQLLLSPVTVTLEKDDYTAIVEGIDRVLAMGFGVEDFGDGTVLVRETPIELGEKDIPYVICEIAARLKVGNIDLTPVVLDRLYYSIACRGAVKAMDKNNAVELTEIINRLRDNPEITHCPHGRPVSVKMTKYQIEKMFGRLR